MRARTLHRLLHSGAAARGAADAALPVSFGDVSAAAFRIRTGIEKTPVHESRVLSKLTGAQVFFKNEFMLPTGSFKERGARNAMLQRAP